MDIYERLDADDVADIIGLVDIGGNADGLAALGEQTILNLRHGDHGPAAHLLVRDESGELTGYADLDLSRNDTATMELVVHPMHRNRGIGTELVTATIERARRAGAAELHAWAHGDHPSALATADRFGFTRPRVLWQMRRNLTDAEPEVQTPEEVRVRAFVPGRDEERLLAVNNAAFADHPEQGTWTLRDVAVRERESWFDPAGLLLAERVADGELLGFHWTKVHGEGDSAIGEIYVLGVAPAAQGLRLGGVLTMAGLSYLRGRGLNKVMLYVDESNSRAVQLYLKSGFQRWTTDVNYQLRLAS
ncbi:mycothiol synthase [Stackebrandtia endophytica]|uniref:Mycothiol acetyltransferase n=1 Tax=Stackebrandtia endophytica TaxID=1496996 RepID=A0A543AXW4_9ACTN|nr:mycothiol synthase [Stackebrandtia endophytica]TQL77422.1 mycothiol synthase [Stackebrandtia endophytica]